MQTTLDGGLLGGQAESVPTERVQDVFAQHPLIARDGIADDVVAEVSHVDVARGIGEHYEEIVFLLRHVGSMEDLLLVPAFLPLGFDGGKVVSGAGFRLGVAFGAHIGVTDKVCKACARTGLFRGHAADHRARRRCVRCRDRNRNAEPNRSGANRDTTQRVQAGDCDA